MISLANVKFNVTQCKPNMTTYKTKTKLGKANKAGRRVLKET